jgi:hypothetical protein
VRRESVSLTIHPHGGGLFSKALTEPNPPPNNPPFTHQHLNETAGKALARVHGPHITTCFRDVLQAIPCKAFSTLIGNTIRKVVPPSG